LTLNGRYFSSVYNKFRVSTPRSANHCWKDGFEQRYADLLAAMQSGAVVAVNNLWGMSILEDKALLALFRRPEFRSEFSTEELSLIDEHVLWTARLEEGRPAAVRAGEQAASGH